MREVLGLEIDATMSPRAAGEPNGRSALVPEPVLREVQRASDLLEEIIAQKKPQRRHRDDAERDHPRAADHRWNRRSSVTRALRRVAETVDLVLGLLHDLVLESL